MPWALRMISFSAVLLLLLLFYFGFRYFKSIKILGLKPLWLYRLIYFVPAGLFLLYPAGGQIQYLMLGTFSRSGHPFILIYLFWYGLVCMGVMLNWLLLHDLLRPVLSRTGKKDRGVLLARGFLIMAAVTVLYTSVKMIRDTSHIVVNEITYNLNDETRIIEPLTIVHISELHADSFTGELKMRRYIEKVNDANPDIVIITGDLISSGRDHIEAGANALSGIEATYGAWFVMGDHDYWVSTDEIAEALLSRGVNVLENENTLVRHNDMVVKITGITELYSYNVDDVLLDALLNENSGQDLHLLASHQATDRIISAAIDSGVNKLLAGHTHGGQIRVRLFFYPVTPVRAETSYVKGRWKFGNMLMNINSGLGFTLSPVRYNAPAEVSVIRVK